MIKILFICHGNICRSPMAEYIFKDMINKKGLTNRFFVDSAATSTEELGNPVYPPARRILNAHGISCDGHSARQIKRTEYDKYNMIICMDDMNIRNAKRIFGEDRANKIHLMSEFGSFSGSVADPWYTGDFQTTWDQIHEGCENLLELLISQKHQ